jgi:16S rRNA (uracil1498-N3)-methyltransferase
MSATKPKIRLFVNEPLRTGALLTLAQGQSHYLSHVMRARAGDAVAVFNGSEGQWRAEVQDVGKKSVTLVLCEQMEKQKPSPDIWLVFAPIKNKTELVVEKATELGASALLPVFTRHAVVRSVNMDKLQAHAIEAAEQCERHDVPRIEQYKDLGALLSAWPQGRTLLYADESGVGEDLKTMLPQLPKSSYAILIGPEGGFAADEQHMLRQASFVRPFCMGPRILRADTAAVAALACVQAWLGDWQEKPHFEAAG